MPREQESRRRRTIWILSTMAMLVAGVARLKPPTRVDRVDEGPDAIAVVRQEVGVAEKPAVATAQRVTAPIAVREENHSSSGAEAQRDPTDLFPHTEVGELLNAHARIESTPCATIAESEALHAASMARLEQRPQEVARLLSDAYFEFTEMHYDTRWVTLSTLAELDTDYAFDALARAANAPMPQVDPKAAADEDLGPASELALRMTAIEGLASLARHGNRAAEDSLLALATQAGSSGLQMGIKTRAIKGFIAAGADHARREELLARALPEAEH